MVSAGLDCGEFPCIPALQGPADGSFQSSPHALAIADLRAAYEGTTFRQGSAYADEEDDGQLVFGEVLALIPPEGLTPEQQARLDYRLKTFELAPEP